MSAPEKEKKPVDEYLIERGHADTWLVTVKRWHWEKPQTTVFPTKASAHRYALELASEGLRGLVLDGA